MVVAEKRPDADGLQSYIPRIQKIASGFHNVI